MPLGYVAAAGLLLVSALGGMVFAVAAVVDNLISGPPTEPAMPWNDFSRAYSDEELAAIYADRAATSAQRTRLARQSTTRNRRLP